MIWLKKDILLRLVKQHMNTHLPYDQRPYACKYKCGKRYASKWGAKDHELNIHEKFKDLTNKDGNWICKICRQSCKNRQGLSKHMSKKHPVEYQDLKKRDD